MNIPGSTTYAYVNITSGTLSIRKRASSTSQVIGSLKRNTCVQLLAYDEDWSYIMTGSGITGFVATKYLRFDADEDTSAPETSATPTSSPTVAPQATQPAVDDGFADVGGSSCVYVKVEKAKIYANCSESSAVLATLKYSGSITLEAYTESWCRVSYAGQTGYVRRCDVSDRKPLEVVETDIVFCDIAAQTRYSVQVYKKNSLSSSVVMRLPAGCMLSVKAYNGDWAYVSYGGKSGFVRIQYLKAIG